MTNVRFSHNDHFLGSVGGHDKTLIIWRAEGEESSASGSGDLEPVEDSYDSDEAEVEEETKEETQ